MFQLSTCLSKSEIPTSYSRCLLIDLISHFSPALTAQTRLLKWSFPRVEPLFKNPEWLPISHSASCSRPSGTFLPHTLPASPSTRKVGRPSLGSAPAWPLHPWNTRHSCFSRGKRLVALRKPVFSGRFWLIGLSLASPNLCFQPSVFCSLGIGIYIAHVRLKPPVWQGLLRTCCPGCAWHMVTQGGQSRWVTISLLAHNRHFLELFRPEGEGSGHSEVPRLLPQGLSPTLPLPSARGANTTPNGTPCPRRDPTQSRQGLASLFSTLPTDLHARGAQRICQWWGRQRKPGLLFTACHRGQHCLGQGEAWQPHCIHSSPWRMWV